MNLKTIFILLDTGLATGYFFESDLTSRLLEKGFRLVFLVQDAVLPHIRKTFSHPNAIFDSMRDGEALHYQQNYKAGSQERMDYLRRTSASTRIPLTYVDTHRLRKEYEAKGRRKWVLYALRPLIWALRRSSLARRTLRLILQNRFTPHIYDDLFTKYKPDLVISNTAGWRLDQYLLREATRVGIPTATVIVGWDNPSSQGLPGAFIDDVIVWSEQHKRELVLGVDWPEEKVHIGGMPVYDGYITGKWVVSKAEYYRMHQLDPQKKLVAFAATALSISPNIHLVEILVNMITQKTLSQPAQLLIRLHPNHFKKMTHYRQECEAIRALAAQHPDVHVVEPAEVPGGMERYSGEDFPEKASMMAYADVVVTVYSTMVVETALHDCPFISACIDSPQGWGEKFSVRLSQVPHWPTASRVNKMKAGRTVLSEEALNEALNEILNDRNMNNAERRRFLEAELTYLDGSATQRTAEILASLVK